MGTIHRLDKKPQLLDPANAGLEGQNRVNAEIFTAVEILGRKLERVEAERDRLAARLAVIETAAAVDRETGKIYLPVALNTPENSARAEASPKWMLTAVALTGLISLGALSVALLRPMPQMLSAEQAALLDSLKVSAAPESKAAEALSESDALPVSSQEANQAAPENVAPEPMTPEHEIETEAAVNAAEKTALEATTTAIPATLPSAISAPANSDTGERDAQLPADLRDLETRALDGNAAAQHDLGAIYAAGEAVAQDYVRARYWFEKAAAQDIPNAHYNLGVIYQQGLGVTMDAKQAVAWYENAARLEHPQAMYNLGIAYAEGNGVTSNVTRAIEYFKEASAAGVAQAAYNLGILYESGMTGTIDIPQARIWYQKAADAKHAEAQEALKRLAGVKKK